MSSWSGTLPHHPPPSHPFTRIVVPLIRKRALASKPESSQGIAPGSLQHRGSFFVSRKVSPYLSQSCHRSGSVKPPATILALRRTGCDFHTQDAFHSRIQLGQLFFLTNIMLKIQSCTNISHIYKVNLLRWRLFIPRDLRISPSNNFDT